MQAHHVIDLTLSDSHRSGQPHCSGWVDDAVSARPTSPATLARLGELPSGICPPIAQQQTIPFVLKLARADDCLGGDDALVGMVLPCPLNLAVQKEELISRGLLLYA